MALDDTGRAVEGYLGAVAALEGARILEAMSACRKTVMMLKAIVADEFVQYNRSAVDPVLHSCLEGAVTKLRNR